MKRTAALIITCMALTSCTEAATKTALVSTAAAKVSSLITLDPKEKKQFNLTVARVQRVTVPEVLTLSGQIEPDTSLTTPIVSLMPGRIERAPAQLGEIVRKGQVLAEIRSDEVAQVESDLLRDVLSLDADITETQVDDRLARSIYERKAQLLAEGISAKADVDGAKRDVDHTTARLESLRTKRKAFITSASERLRLFGVHPEEVERLLQTKHIDNTFDLRSPRSGVISERDADVGQLIDNVHKLFVVSDLCRVWVMADVYEKDIERVQVGDPAKVNVDSFSHTTFNGKVDYMATNVSADTRTLKVRVIVDNDKLLLRPKMFGRVTVQTGQKSILAIPLESVQKIGETYVAYVQTGDNTYIERKIGIGATFGKFVEVLSGVSAGETVVAHGSLELQGEMLQRFQ